MSGPRGWQAETFARLGEHLRDPRTRHTPFRDAVASGHGIGKSAEIAMLAKWALDTRPGTRVLVAANTEAQITGKTWPELLKWHRLSRTRGWFRPLSNALVATQPGWDRHWRADAAAWSANHSEAFAGLHNFGERLLLIFDDASGIDDRLWEVAEGALTDAGSELIWLARGNPTRLGGAFRRCFGRHRTLWRTRQIDSRSVEGVNHARLEEMAAAYGADSDFTRVRIRGDFPHAPERQFIPAERVTDARTRPAASRANEPLVFGLDCARFGEDGSVLAIRRGCDARSWPWWRWQGADTMQLAGDVALAVERWRPHAIFVDGGAMGAGVIDRLRQLGVSNVHEVGFGAAGGRVEWAPGVPLRAANNRARLWGAMRSWLATGAIPDDQRLADDLTAVRYAHDANRQIRLEPKSAMKARGLASPDDADALACTFAEPAKVRAS